MNFWGGDIQSNGSGTVSATGGASTLIDTTRPEPDDEWSSAFIVLNPGTSSNVIWRRVADTGGWVQNTGTFTITGTWPSPYTAGVTTGVTYEVYKTFRPENWLQAINFAITKAYPKRHRAANVELPVSTNTRILNWRMLAKAQNALTNPTVAPTVTEVADGQGTFQAGAYTFSYTLYNDFGETLQSPTTSLTIAGTNSRVKISALNSIPAGAVGAYYYSSFQPGDTTLDRMELADAILGPDFPNPANLNVPKNLIYQPGINLNGTIYSFTISTPDPWYGVTPPSYNTTNVDFFRLHQIQQRINPGAFPELWNDLPPTLYKRIGEGYVQLMFLPISAFKLKLIMTTTIPTMAAETDSTLEPTEMIMEGAESYLWRILTKTSTIVNVNWQKLHDQAWANYNAHLAAYAMDIPRDFVQVPIVRSQY